MQSLKHHSGRQKNVSCHSYFRCCNNSCTTVSRHKTLLSEPNYTLLVFILPQLTYLCELFILELACPYSNTLPLLKLMLSSENYAHLTLIMMAQLSLIYLLKCAHFSGYLNNQCSQNNASTSSICCCVLMNRFVTSQQVDNEQKMNIRICQHWKKSCFISFGD